MQLDTILLISALVVELGLGTGIFLLWRRSQVSPQETAEKVKSTVREELSRQERYLDGKVDLLLARLNDLRKMPLETEEEEASVALEAPPTEGVGEWAPPDVRPGADDLSESEELALLLDSPAFCSGIWPQMDGPFGEAAARLLGYLAAQGVAEPEIEPYPSTGVEYENHWYFLVVWSHDAEEGSSRFLIPRNFSRYDPAKHDHLFRKLGGGEGLENFIKELRKCAVLRGTGPLEGFISPDLRVKKGVFVV